MISRNALRFLAAMILLAVIRVYSQTPSETDVKLIAAIKNVPVNRIEAQLPGVGLEHWLQGLLGKDSEFSWGISDCGEESGNPADRTENDSPTCVEAYVKLRDRRTVVLEVTCGTMKKPHADNPSLVLGQVASARETINLRRLSDLPAALMKTRG